MLKNSIQSELSEPGLFVIFDAPKFTARTPVATISEQPVMGDDFGKFIQFEQQPALQDIEKQLSLMQAVSQRTQMLTANVLLAMTSVQLSEIDFWSTNILDQQNNEARKREIQCSSILLISSIRISDEMLNSKRNPNDKMLQNVQALALYNFRIDAGILAHLCEHQQEQHAIHVLSQMIHNLRETEKTHFAKSQNENDTIANYFQLAENSTNSYLDSQAESHMLRAQVIARSDTANKDPIGIFNLLFGIQLMSHASVKTKRFRQLSPSATQKQIMRPMLNQNEIQTLGQNQEKHNNMPPPNSGPRGQPPPGQGPSRPNTSGNAAIPQETIFPPVLNIEQEISEILNIMVKETIKYFTQTEDKALQHQVTTPQHKQPVLQIQ
ncbi:MAG: hypothetical protein EZS28_021196 [Streblomastix strix]|uniref:Uncharacterized protein n=1 Tax=Streblomastix strix TaxID=222440 RepID=A0A5J4VL03_9EUKA|nr:MAG: hypothetical protein EZS28_021196 [Streblomastix strix]